MNTNIILAIISIIFGILVIAWEGVLRWIVGIFFVLLGIWLLIEYFGENKNTKAAVPQQPQEPISPEKK